MDVDPAHLDLPHRVRLRHDGQLLPEDGDEAGAERLVPGSVTR